MANWPTSPEWYDPALINSGKKYTDNDGVVVSDMNAIIEDLLYLKKNGTGGNGGGGSKISVSLSYKKGIARTLTASANLGIPTVNITKEM